VRYTLVIEVDDVSSKRLKKNPLRELRRIVRLAGDQVGWGDESRPVVDKDDIEVGTWKLTKVE
jgi:hypothetical protein